MSGSPAKAGSDGTRGVALHDWLMLTGAGGFVDNSAMKDRHDYRFGAAAAILLLLVPLIYPLSIGPAAAMFNAIGQPEPLGSFLEAIYAPLLELPEPFDSWVEQYMGLWCP